MNENSFYSISPTEFEIRCRDILAGYAESEGLNDFTISHNVICPAHDTKYQIDVLASFTALGTTIKVLCECKRYKSPVKQEVVLALESKLHSLGAHKGIILSTSRFQKGAIEYAKAHGIALIHMTDHGPEHYSHSSGTTEEDPDDPFLYGERHLPPYRAVLITADSSGEHLVFPPRSLLNAIYDEVDRLFEKVYGYSPKRKYGQKERECDE